MVRDIESFAKEQIQKKGMDLKGFAQILQSPQAKAALAACSQNQGDLAARALESAQAGDLEPAKKLVSSLMGTRDGAALVQQIMQAATGKRQ